MSYRLFNTQLLLIVFLAFSFAQEEGCAPSIRANAEYVASTGFGLGDYEASYQGIEGFVIANTFQLNLEYQPGVDSDAVDVFNNYGEGTVHNWMDPEYYVVTISESGGLPAWSYSDLEEDVDADLQWTITGWGQTILGGSIEAGRLVVTTDYRPFDADAYVNNVEVFEGNILQEVIAYTFDGAASDIGAGTQLGVELRTDACDCDGNFADCAGECGGSATEDCAGDCDGSAVDAGCGCGEAGPSGCDNACGSTATEDCAGECGGSSVDDECGVCGGDNSSCADCAGVPNGDAEDLGCGCGEAGPSGCDNACGSTATVDECGECGGSGIAANSSIRANSEYVASTGFGLGDYEASYQGIEGFVIANTFQINLEYQAGVDSDAVDVFNNYGEGTVHNWMDPEYYVVTISESGGLPAWSYSDLEEDVDADLQWTITGWGQTILGGSIEAGRLVVTTDYRPFDADAYVNNVEVFEGNILQEVIAYTFDGAASDIGAGTQLGVELRTDACDCDGNFADCAGECGGSAVDAGCGCGEAGPSGCDNACGSTATEDCAGECGGSSVDDECGVCGGDNSSCADCAGTPNGSASLDECGVCDGGNYCDNENFCDGTYGSGGEWVEANPDDGIWCPYAASCEEICGDQEYGAGDFDNHYCWCDSACFMYGDCCSDACDECDEYADDPDYAGFCENRNDGAPFMPTITDISQLDMDLSQLSEEEIALLEQRLESAWDRYRYYENNGRDECFVVGPDADECGECFGDGIADGECNCSGFCRLCWRMWW